MEEDDVRCKHVQTTRPCVALKEVGGCHEIKSPPTFVPTQEVLVWTDRPRRPPKRFEPDEIRSSASVSVETIRTVIEKYSFPDHGLLCWCCGCGLARPRSVDPRGLHQLDSIDGATVFGGAKLPTMQLCHVVSDKHGGPATVWNLRPGCADCNAMMGPQNFFEFCLEHDTPISRTTFWLDSQQEHEEMADSRL